MNGKLIIVDHGKHRVEVHKGAGLGNIEGKYLLKSGVLQQVAGKGLRAGNGRSLGKADGNDVPGKHQHVAALNRIAVAQVIPHLIAGCGKALVIKVHILEQQGLSLSGRGVHTVDVDAFADAGAGVTREVKVGHRVGDERIVVLHKVHQRAGPVGSHFRPLDTGNELCDHFLRRHSQQIAGQRRSETLGVDLADIEEIVDKLDLECRICDCPCNLVHIVDDLNAIVPEDLCKCIMFLLCDLQVGDIVKQKSFQGTRSQGFEFFTRAVQQNLVQLADFRKIMNTRIHKYLFLSGPSASDSPLCIKIVRRW